MKKSIKLLLIAVIYLSICYGVGQYRNMLKEDSKTVQTNMAGSEDKTTAGKSRIWDDISFEGVIETADTPWNFNAGVFDMEGEGTCILLTPNTAVTISNLENTEKLSFQYEIHPWVKEVSDGAGLLIWVLDKDNNIVDESAIEIDKDAAWENYELDLSGYDNADYVKIQCNNGGNGDDAGDWVVIS